MNNYKLVNKNGRRTCTELYLTSNQPFIVERTKPYGGIQVNLDVYYRQDLENPALPVTY